MRDFDFVALFGGQCRKLIEWRFENLETALFRNARRHELFRLGMRRFSFLGEPM